MGNISKSLQLCAPLCNRMDCSPPGCSVHGILQARILEWIPVPFRRSSQPRDRTCGSYPWPAALAGGLFTAGATREAHIV